MSPRLLLPAAALVLTLASSLPAHADEPRPGLSPQTAEAVERRNAETEANAALIGPSADGRPGAERPAAPPRAVPAVFPRPGLWEQFQAPSMSHTAAIQAVRDGKVDSALKSYGQSVVTFYLRLRDGSLHAAVPASSAEMERALTQAGVELTVKGADLLQQVAQWVSFLTSFAFLILVAVMGWNVVSKFVGNPARKLNRIPKEDRVTFDDVAGQKEAKRELQEVVEFLRSPKEFSRLGARVPRGVLLSGDPGNGKTLLAKAVAGEARVPFMHIAGSEVLEMFAGLGARRIRKMFAAARKHRNGCILFIDEIETIGGRRGLSQGGDAQSEREQILNQLLVELDGVEKRGNIVVLGATNRPDMLDPALVRPGRLDRSVHVPKPDAKGREEILRVHARKMSLAADVRDSLDEVARMTPGFSGAELANLWNEAAIQAGRWKRSEIDMECVQAARDKMLMGEARPADSVPAEERAIAAHHEAGHALVALRTPGADPVHKITVLPRGQSLGMVATLPLRDRNLHSRSKLEADLVFALGGRAAETLVYGADLVTSGALSDIRQATRIAREMGGRLGMFEELGCMDYLGDQGGAGAASPETLALLDRLVARKLKEAEAKADALVRAEERGLRALAARLLAVDTMTGDEARALLDAELAASRGEGPEAVAA